ncbi:MAG: hypothetical protein ACXWPM_06890 [Bdellovibrionota bacterium]
MREVQSRDAKVRVWERPYSPDRIRKFAGSLLELEWKKGRDGCERRLDPKAAAKTPALRSLTRRLPITADHELTEAFLTLTGPTDTPRIRPTRPHCARCTTVVVDLNWKWNPNWAGELFFYDAQGDSVFCVSPRVGRIVWCSGKARYRIGVPRVSCALPRMALHLVYRCARRPRRGGP